MKKYILKFDKYIWKYRQKYFVVKISRKDEMRTMQRHSPLGEQSAVQWVGRQFWEIYFSILRNVFLNLNNYICQFEQICLKICTEIFGCEDEMRTMQRHSPLGQRSALQWVGAQFWRNIISNLKKYILNLELIYLKILTQIYCCQIEIRTMQRHSPLGTTECTAVSGETTATENVRRPKSFVAQSTPIKQKCGARLLRSFQTSSYGIFGSDRRSLMDESLNRDKFSLYFVGENLKFRA